jgi:hypothetical protein
MLARFPIALDELDFTFENQCCQCLADCGTGRATQAREVRFGLGLSVGITAQGFEDAAAQVTFADGACRVGLVVGEEP